MKAELFTHNIPTRDWDAFEIFKEAASWLVLIHFTDHTETYIAECMTHDQAHPGEDHLQA